MLFFNVATVIGGSMIDSIWGDPPRIPHPVVGLGKVIAGLDKTLNSSKLRPIALRLNGIITVLATLAIAFGSVWILLDYLSPFPWLFWPVNCWLMGTTVARKGLSQAGLVIYELLSLDELEKARAEAGKIVGRDTSNLERKEVIRAAVESVAENAVDGVIAPLFYGVIGGAPLAMLYRAVNTLDSMLGYKNERYQYFGWAAARLDDWANLLPARIGAVLMVISSGFSGGDWLRAIKTVWKDAGKHPSPNSGWPEAAIAGALGVRLGGVNHYQGIASCRDFLGEPLRDLEDKDIRRTVRILNITTLIVLMAIVLAGLSWEGVN